MLLPVQLDLKTILGGDQGFSFLVGAGISMDPPAGLASARQLMDGIIRFSAPPNVVEEIRQIPSLRYENLVEQYHGAIDQDLVFMRYFNESSLASDRQPNAIHRYLAKMLATGNPVMTTNFDHFIERAVGLDNPRLVDVITSKDFDTYGDLATGPGTGKMVLYKLHGSSKNPVTGEDTSSTVITTLSALGKGKGDDIFSVEAFKRPLFEKISYGRKLVVMGYSGGDDLDIVPMLSRMKGVRSVFWLVHSPGPHIETFKVLPDMSRVHARDSRDNNIAESQNDLLASIAWALKVEVIKIVGPTAAVLAKAQAIEPNASPGTPEKGTACITIEAYLASKLPPPSAGARAMFAGNVFIQNNLPEKALHQYKAALSFYEKMGDKRDVAIHLGMIGAVLPAKEGLEYYTRALSLFEELGDKKGIASQLVSMSTARLSIGQTVLARDGLLRAIHMFENEGFDEGVAIAYTMLANAFNFLGDLNKAKESHEKSIQAANRVGDLGGIANALESKAQFSMDVGDSEAALALFKQSIAIHEKLRNKQRVSRITRQLGDVANATGRHDQAMRYYKEALETSRSIGDLHGSGEMHGCIANLLAQNGKYDVALAEYDQMKTIFEELGDWYMIALTLSGRSEVLLMSGDVDGALARLQRAKEIFDNLGDKIELPNIEARIGTILDVKGDYNRAIKQHERALQLHQNLGVKGAIAHDISNIGLVYLHLKDHDKALLQHKKALEMFQDLHDPAGTATQFHNIAQVHENLGHYFLARFYFKYAVEREMATHNPNALMFRRIDLATISLKLGMVDEAAEVLIYAINDAEEAGDSAQKKALEDQVDRILERNDAGHYFDNLLSQCETARKHKDKKGLRRTTLLIALYYMDNDMHQEAITWFTEALTAFDRSGEDEVIAAIHEYIGDMYADLGKFENSLAAYECALRVQEKLGNREQFSDLLGSAGNIELALGKEDLAMARLKRSLDILDAIGDERDAAGLLALIGSAHVGAKRLVEGKNAFVQAIERANKAGDPIRKAEIQFYAAEAFLESGDAETAKKHLTEAFIIANKFEKKDLAEKIQQALNNLKDRTR